MASKAIKGITVEIGGDTTKLGKALEGSEKKSKSLQSELREIERLLKFDPTNVELLAQKQDVLKNAISETATKLDTLKEAEAQVVAQFERGEIAEEQLRAFQREIVVTENKLNGFKSELKSLDSAVDMGGSVSELDKLTSTINDQESELSELKTEYTNVVLEQGKSSKEAKELKSKMETLNDELKENKQKLSDAEEQAGKYADALEDTGDASDEASGGFTIMKGALGDLVSNIIQSAISKIGDLVGSLLELSEATEEYRTMQSKLSGSADTFGYSADFAKSKYEEFYKYLGDDQAATNAITNLMGVGTSTESLSKLVDGATAAWATYGDSINVESLTEAINETITCGKVTGSFADTINWCKDANDKLKSALGGNKEAQKAYNDAIKEGLPVEDAFNEALAKITDEQERADVVAQFLNSTYGDSKKTYDELNSSVIEANESELKLKDTQAKLGETVAPVNNAITELKNKALVAITPIVEKLVEGLKNLYHWFQEHPTAMKIVTAIVIALGAAFGVLATVLAIQGLIRGVTMAFQFLNTTLLANPIVLIVAAIAGLVAAFIYLWNNCEGFRQFWIDLWEWIKVAAKATGDWFVQAWTDICNWFVQAWKDVSGWFVQAWSDISNFFTVTIPNLFSAFVAWLESLWNGFCQFWINLWESIKHYCKIALDATVSFFKSAWSSIKKAWSAVIQWFVNIWTGIKNTFSSVGSWFGGKFRDAWIGIKNAWSSVKNWFKNLWSGIKNIFSGVGAWFGNTFRKAWTSVKNAFASWGSFFGGLWTKIKDKFSAIGTNISNAISSSVKSGLNGVISSIESIINGGIGLINGAIDIINKIPKVNIGKIGSLNLPRLARGGIVDSPTLAEIGEDGREAIIPLEHNTEWLDVVAQKLNDRMTNNGGANTALFKKLDRIYNRLNHLQVVLNNGVLVGEILDDIDAGLADKQLLLERGV